ncbi:MAG: hypothetical protein FJ291_16600 [Planctomycetes bacterium]|nr:hypothetical protein [Planctomycetota bacterium]
MAAPRRPSPFNAWETVRCELLNTRVCDLGLAIEGSPVEPFTRRLRREFAAKGLAFRPDFYLTDSWGCPDRVPVIGVPFYLADKRLTRIEEEQTGEIEDDQMVMMLVRHEAGHAVNYAYRLWEQAGWAEAFGRFSQAYRESFQPEPSSRQFVRHIFSRPYGRTYAQKHPDEDFAETFAVWLTPRAAWRRRYRAWPALAKLRYVDALMQRIRKEEPARTGGKLYRPVEEMDVLLAEHYGQRAEHFRAAAQGYVDDRLRAVFPALRGNAALPASQLLRRHHDGLIERMVRWSALTGDEARTILEKLEDRADALHLAFRRREISRKLMDVAAMATGLAMEFAYTGRLMG